MRPMLCVAALAVAAIPAGAQTQPFAFKLPAPELRGTAWLNTPDNKPITLASRHGKVTIVQFWTFG